MYSPNRAQQEEREAGEEEEKILHTLKPNWIALLCVPGCVAALLWLAATGAGTGPITAAAAALVVAVALAWWQSLRPSNERDWQPASRLSR